MGMGAEVHELFARQQAFKSVMSKIEKSQRNEPAVGLLPYGRTFDQKTKRWGIDPLKQQKIQKAAERYVKGESLIGIAETIGINYCSLHKTLKKFCGDRWTVRIKSKPFNVDETVQLTIPRLLSDEMIQAIHHQMEANKTYRHGRGNKRVNKNRYLLGRMIFCTHCGESLSGYANKGGIRYYKHFNGRRSNSTCEHRKFIRADELELAVLLHVVSVVGDPAKMQKAIKAANPDLNKLKALDEERQELHQELKRNELQKENVIDMIADGVISKEEVRRKMEHLRARQAAIEDRLNIIDREREYLPDPKRSERVAALGRKVSQDAFKNNPKAALKRSWEWQRDLLESVFAGHDARGNRLGVYMTLKGDRWQYEIRGHCEGLINGLPLTEDYLTDVLKLDPEYHDVACILQHLREGNTKYLSSLQKITTFSLTGST